MRVPAFSPVPRPLRRGRNLAPGTCGELAQGVLPDGTPFVVTCPIDRGTTVEVTVTPAPELEIVGVPRGRTLLERALRRTAELVELTPARIAVRHATELPVGKGMASSTADIVAAVRALADAAGVALPANDIGRLAASIEPSDAVMYDGIVASDRRSGELVRAWNWWPSYAVAMVVPPETFVTAGACFDGQAAFAGDYAALLGEFDAASARRDAAAFARAATRSAELGQAFVPNATFAALAARAPGFGALGVCAAHTGTVAGALFPRTRAGEAAAAQAARELRAVLPADHAVLVSRTPASPGAQQADATVSAVRAAPHAHLIGA